MKQTETPTQLTRKLIDLENLAKRTVRKITQNKSNASIKGFLGEFSKVQAHLSTFRDLDATRKLLRRLRMDEDIIRSKQTKDYIIHSATVLEELCRGKSTFKDVLWSLGWLRRLFVVENSRQPLKKKSGAKRR